MRIASTGVVGIGTSSPVGILHLQSDDNGMVFQSSSSSNSRTQIFFQNNGGTQRAKIAVDPDGGNANVMAFSTGTTERMRINSTGNVQISTSAGNFTDALLTARNAGNSIDWGHTNTAGYGSTLGAHAGSGAPFVGFSCGAGTNSNTFRTFGLKGALITTDNAGSLLFSRVTTATADNQTPTESMRIDSSGGAIFKGSLASHQTNAGVVEYSSNITSIHSYGATSGTGVMRFLTGGGGGSGTSERMRIDSSGQLLLGTTSAIGSASNTANNFTFSPSAG